MWSAVIAAVAMLIIVLSFVVSFIVSRRERKQETRSLALQTRVLSLETIMSEEPLSQSKSSSGWQAHRRSLVSLGLLLLFSLAFVIQGGLAGGGGIVIQTIEHNLTLFNLSNGASLETTQHKAQQINASANVTRIFFADPTQYSSSEQLQNWSSSACSALSMAVVMNSYGHHIKVSDIVAEELKLGVWDENNGLLVDEGVAKAADHFGFATDWNHSRTIQDLVDISNQGKPVIVSVRDGNNFPNGHIFVIKGGDDQSVFIADSSPLDLQKMDRGSFQNIWQGFSAVLTPR